MPWAETSQKNTLFGRFWAGSILENGAPVQAGARFSRNHSVQKNLQKGTLLTSFLEAFRYQNPQQVDFGTTLKFTAN